MTNAEARFSIALRPRKPEGSLGRAAQDSHLDSHTAPELCTGTISKAVFQWYALGDVHSYASSRALQWRPHASGSEVMNGVWFGARVKGE